MFSKRKGVDEGNEKEEEISEEKKEIINSEGGNNIGEYRMQEVESSVNVVEGESVNTNENGGAPSNSNWLLPPSTGPLNGGFPLQNPGEWSNNAAAAYLAAAQHAQAGSDKVGWIPPILPPSSSINPNLLNALVTGGKDLDPAALSLILSSSNTNNNNLNTPEQNYNNNQLNPALLAAIMSSSGKKIYIIYIYIYIYVYIYIYIQTRAIVCCLCYWRQAVKEV